MDDNKTVNIPDYWYEHTFSALTPEEQVIFKLRYQSKEQWWNDIVEQAIRKNKLD